MALNKTVPVQQIQYLVGNVLNILGHPGSRMEPTILLFMVLTLSIVCVKVFSRKRTRTMDGKLIFRNTLPPVRWTPLNIYLLDGLGTLYHLRKQGAMLIENLVKKYGRSMSIYVGPHQFLATSDPDLIKKVLTSNIPPHLNKPRHIYEVIFSELLKDGLFVSDADLWASHRKVISRAFTFKSFPTYLKFIDDGAKDMAKEACAKAAAGDGTVDNQFFHDIIDYTTIKVTTEIIFGSETFNMSDEELTEYFTSFGIMKKLTVDRFYEPHLLLRPIWMFHKKKRIMDKNMKIIVAFTNKLIDNYRKKTIVNVTESQNQTNVDTDTNIFDKEDIGTTSSDYAADVLGIKHFECFVQQMIKAGHTNSEIIDEVNTFLVGGHDTVAMALNVLLFHLARYPEHQRNCQMEIDELLDTFDDDTTMTLEHLSSLKYLERCVLEMLRLTPAVPAYIRRLDAPLEIKENCVVEAGENVMIYVWALHRDPEIYPNPNEFDPSRFLPENVKKRHSHSFIPFSMGMRNCIGWKIALYQLKVYSAWILRHFEVTTTDNLWDVKLCWDINLKPERVFNMTYKLRK